MHLELSLPAHLVDVPAFAGAPDALASTHFELAATAPMTPTTEPSDDEDDDDSSGAAGAIFNIAILLLIPLGMYFLLIRPQRRRRNEAQALQSSIGVGDEVVTTSGVYGFITAMEEGSDIVWLEIDDDVQIRISRAAISGKVKEAPATAETASSIDEAGETDDDAELDEAGASEVPPSGSTSKPPSSWGGGTSGRPSLKGRSKTAPSNGAESAEPGDE